MDAEAPGLAGTGLGGGVCRYTRVHRRRQVDASVDSDCGREIETQAQEDHPAMVLGRPQKAQGRGKHWAPHRQTRGLSHPARSGKASPRQ